MKASVIIPVRNDIKRLRQCLDRLLRTGNREMLEEIIVVDNGSEPPVTNEWEEYRCVRVVRFPLGGSYAARNEGLEHARAQILAFTDSDCLPAANWLEAGVDAMESAGNSIVAGSVKVFPKDPSKPSAVECYEMIYGFPQKGYVEREHFGVTANLFVRRDVFLKVGPFDDTLYSGGDREWGRRAHSAGYALVYAERASISHPARRTWVEIAAKSDRVRRGLANSDARLQDQGLSLLAPGGPVRSIAGCLVNQRGYSLITRIKASWIIWRLYMHSRNELRDGTAG